ncbi:MAG: sulfatase [Cyclobacteriaceae bacterium]
MNTKIIKFFSIITCLLFLPAFRSQKPAPHKQPNVVIIFMDDMGYGDLESYGGMQYATPHTNRMAAEGMRFTNFYAAQAVCSASRAAILTGCYPNRIGIHGALSPWSKIALHPEEETLAEVLKMAGYQTGMAGKWHLGDKEPYLPLQQGFDEYLGLPYSNDMWPVDYDGKSITDSADHRFRYPPLPLIDGNQKIKVIESLNDQAGLTAAYTKRACQFIRKNKENPFFFYLSHSMPHVPIAVSDKFKGKSNAGLFGDVMMELDWSVGEVMRTLDELNLSENTILIITSDNGPWLNFGNHAGSTGGLREGKGTSFEGGLRVPCIIRWQGKIPAGTVCHKLASTIDLLPTIAALCGAKSPEKKLDGVDISSLMMNEVNANPRDHFAYYYQRNSLEALRKGPWKLVFPHVHRTYKKNLPGYDGWPGAQPDISTQLALYNLRMDPGETLDVQDKFPQVVAQLKIIADQYRKELGDDLTNQNGSMRRASAQVNRD